MEIINTRNSIAHEVISEEDEKKRFRIFMQLSFW